MKSMVNVKSWSMLALMLFACVFAVCFAAEKGEPPGPEDAYIDGSSHAYYGKDQGGWRNTRRQFDHKLYGRQGQRQMLDILDGLNEEAVKRCEQVLATEPNDLESMFNLTVARCALKDSAGASESMVRAVEGGMPFGRFLAGPREMLKPLRDTKEFRRYAARFKIQLIHGPMLGCLTDTSAKFWVRTVDEVPVQVVVSNSKNLSSPIKSTLTSTSSKVDYTAVVEVKALQPDTLYYYDVMLNGKSALSPQLPSFQTYKNTASKTNIQVVFGGGAKFTPANERMWDTIGTHSPQALLLLGDNVYIDFPQQFGEFHKYTYYRRQSRAEFRKLTGSVPVYSIWDDHDCAIGDSWMGPYPDKPSWKMSMIEGFQMNWNNPGYGTEQWPACWFKFSIADVDFFMLDGRFYRTNPYGENPSMLGPVQKAWLLNQLKQSKATFKVLASPVPWDFNTKGKSRDTWNGFRDEREEIFGFLEEHKIDGVVLISADRHRSDARKIERPNGYPFYEFESSRLTNDKGHSLRRGAIFGYNKKPSFGLLSFDTAIPDPTVTFGIISIDNEPIHSLTLKHSEISHKKYVSRTGQSDLRDDKVTVLAELESGMSVAAGIAGGRWYAATLEMKSLESEYIENINTADYARNMEALAEWNNASEGLSRRLLFVSEGGEQKSIAEAKRIYGPVAPKQPVKAPVLAWTEFNNGSWSLKVWRDGNTTTVHRSDRGLYYPAIAVTGGDIRVACQKVIDEGVAIGVFKLDGSLIAEVDGRHPRLAAFGKTTFILSDVSTAAGVRTKVDVISANGRRIAWTPKKDANLCNGDICVEPNSGTVYVATECAPAWKDGRFIGAFREIKTWRLTDTDELEPWPGPGRNVLPGDIQENSTQPQGMYTDWPLLRPSIFTENGLPCVAFRKNRRYTGKHSFAWDVLLCKAQSNRWPAPIRLTDRFCLPDTGMSIIPSVDGYLLAVTQFEHDGTWRCIRNHRARVFRLAKNFKLPLLEPEYTFTDRPDSRSPELMNTTSLAPSPPELKHKPSGKILVWADLHRHTSYSRCISSTDGMPEDCARFERDVLGCQVLCTTEHGHHMADAEFQWVMEQMEAEADGTAILLYGTEPGPNPYEHTNYYAIDPEIALRMHHTTLIQQRERKIVYRALLENFATDSVYLARHFHGGAPVTRETEDELAASVEPKLEPMMEAQQIRGNPMLGKVDNRGPFPNRYLSKGLRLGLYGGSDHCSGRNDSQNHFCLTGLWVDELSAQAVWKAIRSRKTFSCANGKIALYASIDGKPFGEEFEIKGPVKIRTSLSSAYPLQRVALMRDGQILKWTELKGAQAEINLIDPQPTKGYHWYVVVAQAESAYKKKPATAFLSPFYVTVR